MRTRTIRRSGRPAPRRAQKYRAAMGDDERRGETDAVSNDEEGRAPSTEAPTEVSGGQPKDGRRRDGQAIGETSWRTTRVRALKKL